MANNVKRRDLRMIWNGNGVFVPSGYGIQLRDLLFRFLKDEWKVAQIATPGLQGFPIVWEGLPLYPPMEDPWGSDALLFHGKHFQANVQFTMQDVQTLLPQFLQQLSCWIPYVPIDKFPVPYGVLDRLRYANRIITFSKFGQDALEKSGFASTLIYEGTDTNIFKPMDKIQARKELGIPEGAFVVGMIGANKPDAIIRKGWQEALDAFALFYKNHPNALFFYEVNQPGGFGIEEYAHHLGLDKQLFHVDPYMSIFHGGSSFVAKMINTFDITLHPSTTEGFGLVIIESQACGVPVIVNNCTSMPELIIEGKTGEICDTGRKQWVPGGGYIHYADTNSLYEKMETLFKSDRTKMVKDCRDHIVKNFNIDTIVKEKWVPFFESLQNELLPQVDIK